MFLSYLVLHQDCHNFSLEMPIITNFPEEFSTLTYGKWESKSSVY